MDANNGHAKAPQKMIFYIMSVHLVDLNHFILVKNPQKTKQGGWKIAALTCRACGLCE